MSCAVKCLLLYDVPDNRVRAKLADICLDYGLERIQYSVFFGDLSRNRQEEILQKVRDWVGKAPANVQLFPICERDVRLRKELVVGGYVRCL